MVVEISMEGVGLQRNLWVTLTDTSIGWGLLRSTHLQRRGSMLLRKRMAVLLSALLMMMVMVAPPAMAAQPDACGGINCANKLDDSADHDKGGGNDHLKSNQGKGTTRVIGKRRLDYRGGALGLHPCT